MAYIVNTNIENQTNGYLLDAKNVKGGFVVVSSVEEMNSLPAATIVKGSLCYCTGNANGGAKFYQYDGTDWVEKKFGAVDAATESALGLVKSSKTGTTANRDYNVQVNTDGTMKVNVPWEAYTFNGAVSTIKDSDLTASRALISSDKGKVAVSAVTSTELGYLDGVTSSVQTQLNNKTSISVLPNDTGEIKTKYRIAQHGYTSGQTWYFKVCDFPVNNSGNYASAIISGRIGGWVSNDMSYVNALIWNRGTPSMSVIDIAGDASAMSSIWNTAEFVLYTNANASATLYIKCYNYYAFDIDLEVYQSSATITYDGKYISSTPAGTLSAKSSTTTRRLELIGGELYIAGTKASKSGIATAPATGSTANNSTITTSKSTGNTANNSTITTSKSTGNTANNSTITTSGPSATTTLRNISYSYSGTILTITDNGEVTVASNAHTHTVEAHSHGLNSHTHTVEAHSHGLNSHTHTVEAHSHGMNSHTHTQN